MIKNVVLFAVLLFFVVVVFAEVGQPGDKSVPAPPPARKIPGLTTEDPFPNGCVDCHINYVDMNMDTRFSTLLKQWYEEVEPKVLEKAQASAPEGKILKGKHPKVDSNLKDIPAGCLKCHGTTSKIAPPFSRMMHNIHLTGGEENFFLTVFQGECTYCHKMDSKTGQWSIRTGAEK